MPYQQTNYDIYGPYSGRAMDLLTNTLTFVPKIERERYVDTLVWEQMRERQTMHRTLASKDPSLENRRLPVQRLHDGMKTSLQSTNMLFSTPGSIGEGTDRMLEKQRKAERRALQNCGSEKLQAKSAQSCRKLPW